MKNLIKYLAVLIVAIVISATVFVKASSNQTIQMQNKEALAIKAEPILIPCIQGITGCTVTFRTGDGGTITTTIPAQVNYL